jgi:hypothetical protein
MLFIHRLYCVLEQQSLVGILHSELDTIMNTQIVLFSPSNLLVQHWRLLICEVLVLDVSMEV